MRSILLLLSVLLAVPAYAIGDISCETEDGSFRLYAAWGDADRVVPQALEIDGVPHDLYDTDIEYFATGVVSRNALVFTVTKESTQDLAADMTAVRSGKTAAGILSRPDRDPQAISCTLER